MKKKLLLILAGLLMTLGVCAQTSDADAVAQRGAEKGYYPFAAEVTKKKKLTSLDELTAGKQIMIQHSNAGTAHEGHEGMYLTIYSLNTGGEDGYHITFMQDKPVGVGVWTTEAIEGEAAGTFRLQTAHMAITNGYCYLGQISQNGINSTSQKDRIAKVRFTPATDGSGRWTIEVTNIYGYLRYLYVEAEEGQDPVISYSESVSDHTYFNVYEVEETQGTVKYVEAAVNLIGQGGNTITGTHQGWSDFYEFIMSGDAYGCEMSNAYYDENTNTITADIDFPFPVTGDYVQVPVYLHANANTNKRVAVVDGTLKVIDNEEGDANPNSQWYIRPRIEGLKITYALQNVGTGQYITHNSSNTTISLSDDASYFDLTSNAAKDAFRFGFGYAANNTTYTSYLCNNSGTLGSQTFPYSNKWDFLVSAVPSDNIDLGFIQKYPVGTSFWNKGAVDINDAKQCPTSVKNMINSQNHEFVGGENNTTHKVYCASTAIKVNSRTDVTVTFTYDGGGHSLNILGVDIVYLDGTAFEFDYHQGTAGDAVNNNTYTLEHIPAGEYRIRYFVCNTPELNGDQGHNLAKNAGTITVTGANLRLKSSAAPNGDNTYWYTVNQELGTGNRICAEPAYTDWSNNLMLNNDNVAINSAALWCFVGNDTDGYKIYNRAWGADYALATIGSEETARTMMKPVAEASTYDVVFHAYNGGKGQFFIRTHGSENDFLNDRGDYLAKWNNASAYDANGSVMMINEVFDTEVFDEGLPPVVENLKKLWAPWTGNGANSDINTAYANNSSFASWVLGRQQLAGLLDGKVFKFANKSTSEDGRVGRALGVIEVDGVKYMGGVAPENDDQKYVNEYLQIFNNNDGTYKLFHIGANKYFQNPNAATITENVDDAANYTYEVYQDEVQAVHFVSGSEHMHLGNGGNSYKILAWGGIDDSNSRWDVIYDEDAQELVNLIAQAKARYAETQADAYRANVGVPGYASTESTNALHDTFNGGLFGKTFAQATDLLTNAMGVVTDAERAAVYPTDCYFTITNCGTTSEPRNISVIYDDNKADKKDQNDGVSEFLWHNTSTLDKNNPDHLWCFYHNEKNDQYYLYNVGKKQFASPIGKGDYGLTWIFSDTPVAITMTDLGAETPTFHIKGGNETMSVSTGYEGSVITWYSNGDAGVPFVFEKSELEFEEINLEPRLAPGFYTLKCGNAYLSDDRYTDDTTRSMTEGTPGIKNIFYNTEDNALVGFASGFGFVYATCNTGKPEDGYNTFEYGYGDETGTFTVKSQQGTTNPENANWNTGRYFKKDGGKLLYTTTLEDADSWTIEKVTELPVKLTTAQNLTEGGAYGTIWSPVALEIPEGITAYTGYVTSECELVLEAITGGVIPAETGVVLWDPSATETYTAYLTITDAEATGVSNDNKFVGWVMTKANPNTVDGDYYSLTKKNERMAFYRYVGTNLQGFRARIEKSDAPQGANALTIRFNTTTGIEEVLSAFQNGTAYDLSGRRVATPEKGLYIVNGRKVFIK